MQNTGQNMTKI